MNREFMDLTHQREPVERGGDLDRRDRKIASNFRATRCPP